MEKCGNFWKHGRFSGRIWPDWGNAAQADMAGLGSIGLKFGSLADNAYMERKRSPFYHLCFNFDFKKSA